MWDDLDGASGTGSANYSTTGAAGNRIFTIEWLNWQWNYAATGATISFQVKLYEGSNKIDFIYRPEVGTLNSPSASIGIAGVPTGAGNYLSLNNAGAAPVASSTAETTTIATKPADGQVYTFSPPPACSGAPTGGTVASTLNVACAGQSFTLSVNGSSVGSSGLTYQWQSSQNNTIWNDIAGATSASYVATQSSPTYYRRKISCGKDDSFSTSVMVDVSAAESIPYVENFENVTAPAIPACTSVQDVNGGTTWSTFKSATPSVYLPSTAIRYSYSTTLPADDWFFTKALSLSAGTTYQLKFRYGASDGPTYTEKLEVKIGNAPNAAGMSATALFNNNNINNNISPNGSLLLGDTAFTVPSSGTYYVGFHAYSAADQGYLYLDSIKISAPSCSEPKSLSANGVTASAATLNWKAPGIGIATMYEYVVTTAATPPASGASTSSNTTTISGLLSNTLYYAFVRTNCGGGFSDWNYITFRTSCSATQNVPYTENFEGTLSGFPVPCITVENSNADVNSVGIPYTWTALASSTYTIAGSNSMVYLYNSSNTSIPADDWFFTPGLNLVGGTSYTLKFKYKTSTSFPERLEIKYGNTATSAGMTSAAVYTNSNLLGAGNAAVAFTAQSTGVYNIGFHAFSVADEFYLSVDDIELVTTESLPVTITQFKGERQGNKNVLSWTTQSEQNSKGFELERSANGSDFSTISFIASASFDGNSSSILKYTFDDIKPGSGTNYYRLKQVDKDGKFTLSNVVTIKGPKSTQLQIVTLYPNPVINDLKLSIESPANDGMHIALTDVAGKVLVQKNVQVVNGSNNILLNVSALPAGTYFIKAMSASGSESTVRKLVKQ